MKERLPIWFQLLALLLLTGVFMAAVGCVWQDYGIVYRFRYYTDIFDILYLAMPISILFLCGRFFWMLASLKYRNNIVHSIICCVTALVMLPALLALGYGLVSLAFPPKIRESSLSSFPKQPSFFVVKDL